MSRQSRRGPQDSDVHVKHLIRDHDARYRT